MRYENNDRLREYLDRGAVGAYREHLRHPRFEFNEEAFAAALDQVCAQFPDLPPEDARARAAFRLLTSGVAPEVAVPLPSRWFRVRTFVRAKSIQSWPWLKLAWAVAVLLAGVASVLLLSALVARAEPTPQNMRAYWNAMRGVSLLAASPAELAPPAAAAPQQPSGIILQFQQGGSALATRPAGLVAFNCSTGMSCSFSGTTFTLTSTGAGGSGCVPPGTSSRLLYDDGAGGCADTGLSWSGSTATAPSGVTLTYSGSGIINARNWAGTGITNSESLGKIPIGNGDGTASWADPFVSGICAHDAACTSTNPVLVGGYASAAAPADVSADGDGVRGWFLRNGSQVFNLASGGTLVTLGQKAMASSLPVAIASDQGAIPASQSGTWNIGTVTTLTGITNQVDTNLKQVGGGNTQIATNGLNSTGTGIQTAALVGQLDDTSPNTCTENQFCNARISSKGVLYGQIRDAAGNERGANVDASNRLSVTVDNVSATNISTNVAQMNGAAVTMDNGVAGAGVQRVAIAADNSNAAGIGASATGSAVPSAAHYDAGNGTGNLTGYLNCDNTAVYDTNTNGSTQLVALTASQKVYVCGFQISQSTASSVSVKLVYGTGTACATGETAMTPNYPLQAATSTGPIGMVVMMPGFTGLATAASNALCIKTNAAVSVQALVWYTKF